MSFTADAPVLSRRSLVFVAIILLHVGIAYVLNEGLSHSVVDMMFGPVETRLIEETVTEEEEPPPPPPKIETPPPFVPPPELAIELPAATESTTAIQAVTRERPVAPPPPPAPVRKAVVVMPKQNPKRPLGSSEEFYPPASKRAGEEGTVVVAVLVKEDGRVGDVKIQESSGFPRLDEGALKYCKTWRLLPGTEDGKPKAMWGSFRVTFKLKD